MKRIMLGVIVITAMVVSQAHGQPFWALVMGPIWGWPVSLFWEGVSLYGWWQRDTVFRGWWWAKWMASALLVMGMVIQGVGPLLDQRAAMDTRQESTKTLANLSEALKTKAADGQWVSNKTMQTVAQGATKTQDMPIQETSLLADLGRAILAAMAMPMLYTFGILALTTLAQDIKEGKPQKIAEFKPVPSLSIPCGNDGNVSMGISTVSASDGNVSTEPPADGKAPQGVERLSVSTETENERGNNPKIGNDGNAPLVETVAPPAKMETPPPNDLLARRVQVAVKSDIEKRKISQAEFCRENGINARELSLLFSHYKNLREGKRTVSRATLLMLETKYLLGESTGI